MESAPHIAVLIYAAYRMSGIDGAVERDDTPLSESAAIERLTEGGDIVVSGGRKGRANRNKARELTIAAFGGFAGDELHDGRMALYHFHPPDRNPEVHVFFDTTKRYAKKRKKKK